MLKGRPTSSFPCSRSVSDPIRISATFKDISLNQPQRLPPFEFRQLHCRSLNLGIGYAVAGGRSCRLISPLLDTHSASPGKSSARRPWRTSTRYLSGLKPKASMRLTSGPLLLPLGTAHGSLQRPSNMSRPPLRKPRTTLVHAVSSA